MVRFKQGRKARTSYLLIDAQSVKNTDRAEHRGDDAGKKISGIKRHLGVDTQGFPHATQVSTAEVTNRKGALQAMHRCRADLKEVTNVLAAGGYTGEAFAQGVREIIDAQVQIAKRNELHTFKVIAQRWIVERSFGWLEKHRRLWKNCERKLNTSLQFLHLAFLAVLLKRL